MLIRKRREQAAMTQAQMADALNVNRATVAMWETGKSNPRAEMLPAIAQLLGCTIDELYDEKEVI